MPLCQEGLRIVPTFLSRLPADMAEMPTRTPLLPSLLRSLFFLDCGSIDGDVSHALHLYQSRLRTAADLRNQTRRQGECINVEQLSSLILPTLPVCIELAEFPHSAQPTVVHDTVAHRMQHQGSLLKNGNFVLRPMCKATCSTRH